MHNLYKCIQFSFHLYFWISYQQFSWRLIFQLMTIERWNLVKLLKKRMLKKPPKLLPNWGKYMNAFWVRGEFFRGRFTHGWLSSQKSFVVVGYILPQIEHYKWVVNLNVWQRLRLNHQRLNMSCHIEACGLPYHVL